MKKLYVLALALMTTLCVSAQIGVTVSGNTNTTPNLSASYTSLAAALTDLNAVTAMSGGVTLTLAAGGSETAPATGLTIGSTSLNAVLSSTNTVTLVKAAGAATVLNAGVGTSTPGSAVPDGILKLTGADYVTIDGITFTDGNTTNPATMEFGVGLFKLSATDGAQNNTIQNCIFNMQRVNNANSTAPMVEGSVGILAVNSLATAATTSITPTAASGSNSGNKIYGNLINGGNYGIAFNGYAAPTPFTLGDTGNDIGGTGSATATTGNTITNYGGAPAASNPAAGIRANNQWGLNISNNKINSNDGGGTPHASTLRGIYGQAGTSANVTISYNTVSVKSGATSSACTAIENAIGSTAASNTVNITNNLIQNSSYTTATSGTFSGILNSGTAATVNINANQVLNNSVGASGTNSSVTFQGIYNSASTTNMSFTANNNTVSNNSVLNSYGTLYSVRGSTASPLVMNANTISNNGFPNSASTTSSSVYGLYDGASPVNETYSNNNINNLYITGSNSTSGHVIYGIFSNTSSSSAVNMFGNNVNNLSFTSSSTAGYATILGIYSGYGVINVYKNVVHTLSSTGTSPVVSGLNLASGSATTVNAYNNLIGNISTPNSTGNSLQGIYVGSSGTVVTIYNNTVYVNGTSTGTGFGSSAVYLSSTTPTVTLRNNLLVNLSTPTGTGLTTVVRRTSTTLGAYGTATNNNLLYAGTPSATNVLYNDGTNSYSTLLAYRTQVAPREAQSVTEVVSPTAGTYFQSLTGPATGTTTNFLHLVAGLTTYAESGGDGTGLSLTDDYDANVRQGNTGYSGTGTSPDIGADEFAGVKVSLTDISVIALVSPQASACENNSLQVVARLYNSGTNTINFATTNATVSAALTGAATGSFTATVSTGTLAPGATLDVVLTPALVTPTAGTYNLALTVALPGDAVASNNTFSGSTTVAAVVTLPQSVDFTGYTGSNLNTVFPNWYEAVGATTPVAGNSAWVSTTGVGSTTNVTAKINLYTNTRNEWIIGPKFAVTANSKLKFDVALTDFNSTAVDPAAMQGTDDAVMVKISTDCGATWTTLYTFNAANTTTITNVLAPQEISLSAYAGQNAIIAFFASDGPTDDTPDYDFHIDNVNIVNVLPNDVGAIALAAPAAISCFSGAETVKVTIKNFGTSPLDFSVTPVTVTANVTGPVTATLTGVVNTGTLAPNATLDVTLAGTLNMSASGVYTFNAFTTMAGDAQPSNNAIPATTRTLTAPVTLPQTVDFTGFTGADLTASFPNWYEASGNPAPLGTTSAWTSTTGVGGSSNVTAKINLYTNTRNEWIVGPKITATALTQLQFKIAITDFASTSADPTGMQTTDDSVLVKVSTNCGATWSTIQAFTASNTASISNSLVAQTVSLAAFAGQNIIVAFYASDGPTDDNPDYDFHIDDINISDVPVCTGAVGGTATAGTAAFCTTGSTTITASGYSTGTGSTYQWQVSTDNTNFTDIASQTNPLTVSTGTITATTYYRLKVTCPSGTALAYSNVVTVTINPAPPVTVTPAGPLSFCAPATQLFTATTSATGVTYQWKLNGTDIAGATSATYTASASGSYSVAVTVTATGCSTTSTPVSLTVNPQPGPITITPAAPSICSGSIQQLTATNAGAGLNVVSGTGASTTVGNTTASTLGPNPLQNYYGGSKVQMLYLPSELTALGLSAGSQISAISLNLPTADNAYALQALTIKMKLSASTALSTSAWETGLTTVRNAANYSPVVGLNNFVLDNSFTWDGTSGIVIEINYSNNNGGTTGSTFNTALYSPTSFVSTTMYRVDNNTAALVNAYAMTANFSYSSRNDVGFTTSTFNYVWTPSTGLYTDVAATVPYTGTSAGTVYAKPTATTVYTVTASTTAGCTRTNTVSVTVTPGATITTQPTAQSACAGSSATFTVVASGTGLTYQWRKGGVNIAGATSASYTIASVSAADAANYDVVITGGCGTLTSNAVALTVNAATAITTQPTAQSACTGSSATFTVVATGAGLTYQWRKGGTNIAGATSASYTIASVSAADAANYDVVVAGTCGSVTSNAVALTINAATAITTQPTAQAACAGSSATFTVAATGAGLTYQWRKGGINIAGATSATYTIASVAAADAANYDVVVTGACGSVTSAAVALTLNAATTITTQPTAQTVCAGANATFTVAATGSGTLTYQWRKGGTNISGATSASLALTAVTAASAGSYDVIVTGTCGSVTSTAVTLTVNAATSITTQPTAQSVCSGAAANFSVVAAGSGLTYQWRKGGTNIAGATSATYTIASVAAADAANYDVVVTGTCGSVTSTAVALTVNTAPAITTQPVAVTACQGTANFSVVATGTGLTYQWRFNGTAIPSATSSTLAVPVAPAAGGSYDVVITGTCGTVTSTAVTLTVQNCTSVPNVDATITKARLLPNVVQYSTILRVVSTRTAKINWTVVDMNGRAVMQFDQTVATGQNDLKVTLGKLSSGMYQMTGVTEKGKVVTIRFTRL